MCEMCSQGVESPTVKIDGRADHIFKLLSAPDLGTCPPLFSYRHLIVHDQTPAFSSNVIAEHALNDEATVQLREDIKAFEKTAREKAKSAPDAS